MPFDSLPPQSPINEAADAYARDALRLSREAAARGRTVLDVDYGGGYERSLDIYLPPKAAGAAPVLMFMHGGGFTHGYKEWCGFNAATLVDLPAVFVSVNYRLAPAHRLPAATEDCADALAWIHRHIGRHGGDPNRIHVGGHSAGGYLASMLALRRDLVASRGLPADTVKACFPVSCSYNVEYPNPAPGTGEHKFQTQVLRDPAEAKALSPISHVGGNTTPFFMTWGSRDLERAMRTAGEMLPRLQAQPGLVRHHRFEGFDHFQIHLDHRRPDNPWVRTVRSWMASGPA